MLRLLTVILALLPLTATAQVVEFDSKTFDFGVVAEDGGAVTHTFNYTNISEIPFVIIGVETSCGCTTPIYSKEPLLKGQSAELTVTFDPMDRPGRNSKQILIKSNGENIILRIEAIVEPRVRTLEEEFPFSIGGNARIDKFAVTALRVPIGGSQIVEVGVANSSTISVISVDVDPDIMPKGVELISSRSIIVPRGSIILRFKVSADSYGSFSHNFLLNVNGEKRAEKITFAGVGIANFSTLSDETLMRMPEAKLEQHYIRLDELKEGDTKELKVKLFNQGHSDLSVYGLESSMMIDSEISRRVIPVGDSATITIRYNAKYSGYDSAWVRLILNDPRLPIAEIKIVAIVN